jgi:hypothetical protein
VAGLIKFARARKTPGPEFFMPLHSGKALVKKDNNSGYRTII